MPCLASDLSMDAGGFTPPGIPPAFAPIQIPLPEFDLPTELIEDLLNLIKRLQALFPSSIFKANLDSTMKDVLDVISNILSQLAPFLSLYNFIMAALNMIICIIEVLCAIPNVLSVIQKLKKLFTECLPPFLLLFPWLALIAMILSLILLIIALLEYILNTILGIINQIIQNILLFSRALGRQDAEATLAVVQKIASLLCLIDNILAILIAIAAIISIIQALSSFAGGGICSEDDEEGCCPESICPEFIKNNHDITVTNGTLIYFNRINSDLSSLGLPSALEERMSETTQIRPERWQLYDVDMAPQYSIRTIVAPTPSGGIYPSQIFYPDQEYEFDTLPGRSPYTVDMTLNLNPIVFGHADIDGYRTFKINDCIVVRKPRDGIIEFNNESAAGVGTGTFDLEGGLVFEEDGTTPFNIGTTQATLNTFIHNSAITGTDVPSVDDGYTINSVTFVWKINHAILASNSLITAGCSPEISIEKAVQNAFLEAEGTGSILSRIPNISTLANDVLAAQECASNSIAKFRTSITIQTAATFQSEITECIETLQTTVTDLFCDSIIEAVSQFKSSFSIDADVQFTTRPIVISVVLRDPGGTVISTNIPDDCLDDVLDKLIAEATFGELSDFIYDAISGVFTANIVSEKTGSGELTVSFDNQTFSTFTQGISFEDNSSIEESILTYQFVSAVAEPAVRRGPDDVANVE